MRHSLFFFQLLNANHGAQMKADAVGAEALARDGVAPLPFSPFRHATRALMYGTALCLGASSAGVLAVGYLMGVRNVRELRNISKLRLYVCSLRSNVVALPSTVSICCSKSKLSRQKMVLGCDFIPSPERVLLTASRCRCKPATMM